MSRNHRIVEDGIEALREEQASPELRPKILRALQRKQGAHMKHRILKFSIATIVAAGLIAGVTLIPRESLASSPAKVARAFRQVVNYKVKSYAVEGNKRTLVSETTVEGKTRTTIYYGSDGKPLEEAPIEVINDEKIINSLRRLPSSELVDPEALSKILASGGAKMDVQVNVDGKMQKLPEGTQISVQGVTGQDIMVIGGGGVADAAYLQELLSREGIWKVEHGTSLDRYRLAGGGDGIELDVDPRTFLPKRLRLALGDFGHTEDEFEYAARP